MAMVFIVKKIFDEKNAGSNPDQIHAKGLPESYRQLH